MKTLTCPCCDPDMKPLEEEDRNKILDNLACISNKPENQQACADEVRELLKQLRQQGYEVDSYLNLLKTFIKTYLVIRG